MAFSEEILNSIKERLNFADIVGEFVQLKRSGRNFVGLCPFHPEKSPSFFVRAEESSFNCFGCGKKGSIFQFVMEMRGFRFPEAVRYLAKQAGVVLPEETSTQTLSTDLTKTLQELVLVACEVFSEELWRSQEGKDYLRSRGLSEPTARKFHLGYAPQAWDFLLPRVLERAQARGNIKDLSEENVRDQLVQVGLLKTKTDEETQTPTRYYDAFRDRLMFPITRSDGRPIAFGGRALRNEPNTPKYINSSESPLYLKRKSLFAISQALPEARRTRHVFLVEGYLDVISMYQLGITEVVATCGTAATPQHAEVLKRFVDSVTILFDGDAAGRKAAANCFPSFLNSGLDVEVAFLPQGEDPDSLSKTHSANEFRRLLEVRQGVGEAYLRYLIAEENGSESLSAAVSGRIAQKYAAVVGQVRNAVEREFLMRKGAEVLGVSMEAIDSLVRDESKKARPHMARPEPVFEPPPEPVKHEPAAPRQPTLSPNEERSRAQLDQLYRQLVIAVLCEPLIAQAAMKVTEQEAGSSVASRLFDRAHSFIAEFLLSGLSGVTQFVAEQRAAGQKGYVDASQYPSVQALLAAHGLEEENLLQEAFRQIQIGGTNPNAVLEESVGAVTRLSQQFEVHQLRRRETESSGGEVELLQLAQEKLERRRGLERLRQPALGSEEK